MTTTPIPCPLLDAHEPHSWWGRSVKAESAEAELWPCPGRPERLAVPLPSGPAADFTLCYCDDSTHPSAERESKWRTDLKAVAKDQEHYSPQAHIVRRVITLATVTP